MSGMFSDEVCIVKVAVIATVLFALVAWRLSRKHVNYWFAVVFVVSLKCFAIAVDRSIRMVPERILAMVVDGTWRRHNLLLFWTVCLCASLLFCMVVNWTRIRCSTIHRKYFHLTCSLVCLTGLCYDAQLVWLCAWMLICFFVIIEVFRSKNVSPWADHLNQWLLVFIDGQDSKSLILTPIYLLVGIFLPLLLSPIANGGQPHLYHFAGLLTVGVGDSCAAIVGSKYGVHRWGVKSTKSFEGSLAMFVTQLIASIVICIFYLDYALDGNQLLLIVLSAFSTSIVEALLTKMDNIILPFIAFLILF